MSALELSFMHNNGMYKVRADAFCIGLQLQQEFVMLLYRIANINKNLLCFCIGLPASTRICHAFVQDCLTSTVIRHLGVDLLLAFQS
jgi:hypothetical protein